METVQQRLTDTLLKAGIPAREVKCYGSQVMVTTMGLDSANKWVSLLHKFCSTVRKPTRGYDEKPNTDGYVQMSAYVPVFRVWGTI